MIKHFKRTVVLVVGILFLLVGVVGGFIPVLQGWFFVIVGVLLISITVPKVRVWLEQHTRKYPKIHAMVERADRWLRDKIGEI